MKIQQNEHIPVIPQKLSIYFKFHKLDSLKADKFKLSFLLILSNLFIYSQINIFESKKKLFTSETMTDAIASRHTRKKVFIL